MSYATIVMMAKDTQLTERCAACIAQERPAESPIAWATSNIWQLASSPGWAAAWASAVVNSEQDIGNNDAVITDGMILAAVQARLTALES